MTFPMRGVSTHWFNDLVTSTRYGDLAGSFKRSMMLGSVAMMITVVVSFFAGLAFRRRFWGSGPVFYLAIISLVMPGILVSLGIGQMFQTIGIRPHWMISGLGAHLSWTLPFGLLIMFAVLNRFEGSWERSGAGCWRNIFRRIAVCHTADPLPRFDRRGAVWPDPVI